MGKKQTWDVLVVGGGPAGMLAAVAAGRCGARTALLEKNSRLGRKLAITGGGRCNLTNSAPGEEFIKNIPGNGKLLFSALSRFSSRDCRAFFSRLGVETVEEDQGRVFPREGRADVVVEALERHLEALGVSIFYSLKVEELLLEGGRCLGVVTARGRVFQAKTVVVAAGGASYPATGSSGDGYPLAARAGHTVKPPLPGLVPLRFADSRIGRDLQGLSLQEAVLTLTGAGGKKQAVERGEVIFTHFGLSGPAALKISRYVSLLSASGEGGLRLLVDTLPDSGEDDLAARLLAAASDQPRKTVVNLVRQIVPERLAQVVAGMIPEDAVKKSAGAGRETWRQVSRLIKGLALELAGTRPLAEAMVTVGGVSTGEVDPRTMSSRLVGGLYFAGEVLDIDAYTGGFNIQAAFSSGWLAGASAAEYSSGRRPAD